MDAVVALSAVDSVLGRGPSKTSILTRRGTQVDVRVVAPAQLGAALLYFTGSKGHNIKLRQRALEREWTLNEYALSELEGGKVVASETEEDIYRALGLAFIPPVLREDAGEIEAAATAAVSAASGALVTGSETSSTASIAPRPRTSPICGWRSCRARSRGSITASMRRAAPGRSSSRMVAIDASAAAQATGLPP